MINITIATLNDAEPTPPGDHRHAGVELRRTTLGDDLPVHDGSHPA